MCTQKIESNRSTLRCGETSSIDFFQFPPSTSFLQPLNVYTTYSTILCYMQIMLFAIFAYLRGK